MFNRLQTKNAIGYPGDLSDLKKNTLFTIRPYLSHTPPPPPNKNPQRMGSVFHNLKTDYYEQNNNTCIFNSILKTVKIQNKNSIHYIFIVCAILAL